MAVPHQRSDPGRADQARASEVSGVPKVSIVIRAFNEAPYIGALLEGIKRQTYDNIETILVDSGSTDGTVRIAAPHVDQIVHVAPESFSFGRALNRGCEAASGQVLVFASAHVYPESSSWISNLVAPIIEDGYSLVYGRQRGDHRSKYSEHQVFRSWFPEHDVDDQPSPFCNNANAAINRHWWAQQPYDEELTGLEDIAWAKSTQVRGGRVAYRASAGVIHVHEETYERVFNRYRREAIALRQIFPGAHMSLFEALGLFLAGSWLDLRVAIRNRRPLSTVLAEIFRFRFSQYWGAYRGHNDRGDLSEDLRRVFYYPPASTHTSVPAYGSTLQGASSND